MPTISVSTRHWKNVNIQDLCFDIESQLEKVNLEDGELDSCVNLFESTVRNILDDHAPLKTVYTSPVRDIILKYNLNYHVYADDTQLYITFKSSQEPADSCITTLEKCIQEIGWMRQNFLKLNDEKTKFLLFGSPQQLSKVSLPFITIGDSQITPSSQARNLGVIFDLTMTLKPHISNIVRISSFHIRNISRIRKYLNQSAAEQIIHAFVKSRLDNWNALFYGLPQNQISRLQHIQNTAAHVVTLSRKSCHITPILKELHWLPVSQRIVFKLMLIVHKSVNNIAPIYISILLHAICAPATCHS